MSIIASNICSLLFIERKGARENKCPCVTFLKWLTISSQCIPIWGCLDITSENTMKWGSPDIFLINIATTKFWLSNRVRQRCAFVMEISLPFLQVMVVIWMRPHPCVKYSLTHLLITYYKVLVVS